MLNGNDLYVLYCGFLFFGPLFLFHLFASIMDALCLIRLNGERLGAIEIQINKQAGEELLVWEHKAVPHFFGFDQMHVGGWIKPNILAGIWMFLIFILLCASFCVLAFKFVPFLSYVYIPLVLFLMLFHIRQWILMLTIGFESIHSYFHSAAAIIKESHSDTIEYLAAVIPMIFVLVIAIWCAQNDALSWKSPYLFPLVSVPSIYVGDLIFLPIFNFKAARWFREYIACHKGRAFSICLSVALPVSIALNAYLHYQWIHDAYSGYMDTQYGQLTLAGWCHFAFSTCEMAFVILFLLLWVIMLFERHVSCVIDGQSVWLVFVIFSSMSIADLVFKYRYVLSARHISSAYALADMLPLTSFLLGLAVLGVVAAIARRFK
jgi:hypothetical protein